MSIDPQEYPWLSNDMRGFLDAASSSYSLSDQKIRWFAENLRSLSPSPEAQQKAKNDILQVIKWSQEYMVDFSQMQASKVFSILNELKIKQQVPPQITKFLNEYGWIVESLMANDREKEDKIRVMAQANADLPNGLTQEEVLWLIGIKMDINTSGLSYVKRQIIQYLSDARRLRIDITKTKSLQEASNVLKDALTYSQHIEYAKEFLQKDPIDHLQGGWTVVKVSPGGSSYRPEGDPIREDIELEESITDIQIDSFDNEVFSFRDRNGVPFATLEIHKIEKPPTMEFVGASVKSEAKSAVKEWIDKFKSKGYRPVWTKSLADITDAKDLSDLPDEDLVDAGIAPSVYGFGGDIDTYAKNLRDIYEQSSDRYGYHPRVGSTRIDNLVWYACARGEHKMFESALNQFSELANEWWFDYIDQSDDLTMPKEDDFETEEEFQAAEQEYYKKEESYADYFAPFEFLKHAIEGAKDGIRSYRKRKAQEIKDARKKQKVERMDKDIERAIKDILASSITSGKNWYRRALEES